LDDRLYGIFVGASVHELAQVYGASFAVSEGALNAATLVKLSKVLMPVPLLLMLVALRRRTDAELKSTPIPFPWFIVAFICAMLLNSTFTLHPQIRRLILDFDQFLFLMVMNGMGVNDTPFPAGRSGRPLVGTGLVGLTLSTAVAFGLVALLATAERAAPTSADGAMLAGPGGAVISAVGCAKCHVPSLRERDGDVTLYSGLLHHDMGRALADKIVQGDAIDTEWRTTPLIGLSMRQRLYS
jgi:hypothetical protein